MIDSRLQALKTIALMIPVPLAWVGLDQIGAVDALKRISLDLRFQLRGPIRDEIRFAGHDAPVKIHYVNLDPEFITSFGQSPWHRGHFADAAHSVIELGGAKVVFCDFVFSPYTATRMVPDEHVLASDLQLYEAVHAHPNQIVMAASYSHIRLAHMSRAAHFPLKYAVGESYNPALNAYPETPTFPIWNETDDAARYGYNWGRVGLINTDSEKSGDAVPRWVPLYSETEVEAHGLNFIAGAERFFRRGPEDTFELREVGEGTAARFELVHNGEVALSVKRIKRRDFFAVALEVLMAAEGLPLPTPGLDTVVIGPEELTIVNPFEDGRVLYRVPLTDEQLVEVNWFNPWKSPPDGQTSLAELVTKFATWREATAQLDAMDAAAAGAATPDGAVPGETPGAPPPPVAGDTPGTTGAADRPALVAKLTGIKHWFKRRFNGALVLVGPTDPILQDIAPAPLDPVPVPRVATHGNLIKTIASGRFLQRPDPGLEYLLTFLLTTVTAGLGIYGGARSFLAKLISVSLVVLYAGLSLHLFQQHHYVLPLIVPLGAATSATFVGILYKLLSEERAKSRIKGMFGTYISPQLVNTMVESGEEPRLGGETIEITAFFSDIQGFATLCEGLAPDQLVEIMNEYLNAMTNILGEEGGTLDKYIGDAIVGMFGAPVPTADHAYHACIASQRMQRRQAELREKWRREGEKWPRLFHFMNTRIGLNTGEATIGNMGSERRFNYTMIGDNVNLGARCESAAKQYGVYTMVTEDTKNSAERSGDECVFRYLDRIVVKGRTGSVKVYEIVCLQSDLTDETEACLEHYSKGIEHYLSQRWTEALDNFGRSLPLEPNRRERNPTCPTTPSQVMIDRCRHYMANPPPGSWDGIWVMTSK